MLLSGGKRAGKTYLLIIIFLLNVSGFADKGYRFILGGTTQSSIRRNVLDDMENILQRKIVLDKTNTFELFGCKITCFTGSDSSSYKDVRGFTSYGGFLNEATTLHESFIREVFDRCSGYDEQLQLGAKVLMDTNPENPSHYVKTDYYDKSGTRNKEGKLLIYSDTFTLFDNETLSKDYVEFQIESKPEGMWRDRDIYGKWVSAEGVIYTSFKADRNYIKMGDVPWDNIVDAYCGVDWGYEHYGSIVVIVEDSQGIRYMVEEHAHQHKHIDDWVEIAIGISRKYTTTSIDDRTGERYESYNIPFYVDSARSEHRDAFTDAGLNAQFAKKSVLSGIEEVALGFQQGTLKIVESKSPKFSKEIYVYAWHPTKDEPLEKDDDVLDSLRYAVYTHINKPKWSHY